MRLRLSTLLGKEVITETGWPLGRTIDVRVRRGSALPAIVGLVVASEGSRASLLGGKRRQTIQTHAHTLVPWDAVIDIESTPILVREISLEG
jgi:sporulation protein YlmC with PRC-barrel domain